MTTAEARAESESIDGIIENYWVRFARRGGLPSLRPQKRLDRSRPAPTNSLPVPQDTQMENVAVIVGLRQDLAMVQEATLQWIAEATALKTELSELEAQLAAQSRAGTVAQETIQAARWDWLGCGFVGGCVITTVLFGAFVLYFTA
jgi:hypothetical protein